MNDAIVARARSAPNPFLINRVDSAWEESLTDVPSINRLALEQCFQTIKHVRETRRSRGLLLTGEPGSGKSHLLHRVGSEVARLGKDSFVYIPPVAAAGRIYSELLRRVVQDIVRQPHSSNTTQLETIVIRELVSKDSRVTPEQIWRDMRRRSAPGPTLFETLAGPFEKLTLRLALDPDVALVLRHYLAEHHRLDAYRWLTGYSLPDETLHKLGVNRTLEEDLDARNALFTLSQLAGRDSVLILAFDQLEGMQFGHDDFDGVIQFGNAVSDIITNCTNVACISCVQQYFYADLKRVLPPAQIDRVAQDLGRIELLRPADVNLVVTARLAAIPELGEARASTPDNAIWPLVPSELRSALPAQAGQGITARAVLNAARVLFELWQTSSSAIPLAATAPDRLADKFDQLQGQAIEQSPDEGTLADGVYKLLSLSPQGRPIRSKHRGIDFELERPGGPTGVTVCNTLNMTSLAARLKQIGEALERKKIKRAVLVRDERMGISAGAKVTRSRLEQFEKDGNTFVRPSAAAYAAIAAARKLLSDAASGDLSVEGRTIPTDEVRAWLLAAKPAAAFAFLDTFDAGASDSADEGLEQIRAVLQGAWLLPLEEAVSRAGVDVQKATVQLSAGQNLVGFLVGPPAVVFLRPDGLQRG
jgi:protein-disulfide isomerase-like protein with CxxC motif